LQDIARHSTIVVAGQEGSAQAATSTLNGTVRYLLQLALWDFASALDSVNAALKEINMKRYAVLFPVVLASMVSLLLPTIPCQAQLLQKLEQGLMGSQGQGQGGMFGQQSQQTLLGNVNLPAAQYMMTNVQTGQAFYVTVQNGQMYMTGQAAQQGMMPGQGMMQGQGMIPGQGMMSGQGMMNGMQQQQGGMGGIMNGGLGGFLKKELSGQQGQQQMPNQ
jgi:hypothetical protein